MSAAPITVHNAEVRTAAVEVKTLTIRGKQVTQAVFRQLITEPIIDETNGALHGLPWGTVNYHPGKCEDLGAHLHVVWQKGTELRRSLVRESPSGWMSVTAYEPAQELAKVILRSAWCRAGHPMEETHIQQTYDHADVEIYARVKLDWSRGYVDGRYQTWLSEDHTCTTVADEQHARNQLCQVLQRERDRRDAIAARYTELAGLPQLFIAV